MGQSGSDFSTKDIDNDKCVCKCSQMLSGGKSRVLPNNFIYNCCIICFINVLFKWIWSVHPSKFLFFTLVPEIRIEYILYMGHGLPAKLARNQSAHLGI